MDDNILNMLGLFTVPPEMAMKDREERALEAQLMNAHKDFFSANTDEMTPEEDKNDVDIFVD